MITSRFIRYFLLSVFMATLATTLSAMADDSKRKIVSLNGTWDIAEGSMNVVPEAFPYRVPVPGLIDLSSPDFFEVGIKSERREAFWYHRTFKLDEITDSIVLKIHKAKYGTAVYLNGQFVGEHPPCFTPGYFDLKPYVKEAGETNHLVVRVGAYLDSIPTSMPNGWDFEKYKYIPGIYDSVELIVSGYPRIVNVQAAPQLETGSVTLESVILSDRELNNVQLEYVIREHTTGRIAAAGRTEPFLALANEEIALTFSVSIPGYRLWSPEDPFLYDLELSTGSDTVQTRFGMRSFQFDAKTKRALLNGKPYYMRGTNVCIYRFFEDAARGTLPWDPAWVKRLHETFKTMNWNSIRYCIGFPPEFWYDIADEVGFLIQDEFPIWSLDEWPEELKADAIAAEYREWMRERWNHPCVVIWDAQNESRTEETGKALQMVRHLDLSNRPWDNGWAAPQAETDTIECHPYFFISDHFQNKPFSMSRFATMPGKPSVQASQQGFENPIVINEYAWLWLNRDGSETSLTREVYRNLLGEESTVEQRRELYARYLAAKTEFWRAHRECAAVMHFCGLGYSRPGGIERPVAGATSDHFIDVEHLQLEPYFERYVRDAFAPVGIMVDFWEDTVPAGETRTVTVSVINDLPEDWSGLVRLRLSRNGRYIQEETTACTVPGLGKHTTRFSIQFPQEAGEVELTGELFRQGAVTTQSVRKTRIQQP